jgi:hypothetical protein
MWNHPFKERVWPTLIFLDLCLLVEYLGLCYCVNISLYFLFILEIDRAFKQFVFECMDWSSTDPNGFIMTRDSEGMVLELQHISKKYPILSVFYRYQKRFKYHILAHMPVKNVRCHILYSLTCPNDHLTLSVSCCKDIQKCKLAVKILTNIDNEEWREENFEQSNYFCYRCHILRVTLVSDFVTLF